MAEMLHNEVLKDFVAARLPEIMKDPDFWQIKFSACIDP